MNKKIIRSTSFVLILVMLTMLCACGRKSNVTEPAKPVLNEAFAGAPSPVNTPDVEVVTTDILSDEQALTAVMNYCCIINPSLEDIVKSGDYPAYWNIASSDEHEIVVLFRSYTGAQNRYHIDRVTGDVYVTEFVPGITDGEEPTDESFNARDYLPES